MSDSHGITVLRLGPSLDPAAIDQMLRELRRARNTAVVVEAGEVARISTPALQALLSAWMTWKSDGHDFHVAAASPAFAEAAATLGLPPEFLQAPGLQP